MARLSKEQVAQIIKNAPPGTSPAGVVSALRAQGHELEGYPTPKQENRLQQNQQIEETRRGTVRKVGDFLGISKFGEGIGRSINNLTGGLKPLDQAMTQLQDTQTRLLSEYKQARDNGNTEDAQRLLEQAQEVSRSMQDISKAYTDVGTGGLTNKEVLGSAAMTAGNILLAGAGAKGTALKGSLGARAGTAVKSAIPAVTKPLVRGAGTKAYLGSLGVNAARSAAVGGGFSALGALEDDQDAEGVLRATGIGLLVGAALPPAVELVRGGVKLAQSGVKTLAQTLSKTPAKAIDFAAQNPKATRAAIQRARTDDTLVFKVANKANKAASNIEAKRNIAFKKGLSKLERQLKGQPIDPTPFNQRLKESMQRFNVLDSRGRLNPESIISDPRELKDIQSILKRMDAQKTLTPEGWWNLKRFVSNKYRPTASGEYNALITDIADGLRQEMVTNVKGFDKLLSRYEAESTLLSFLKKELGVTGRARGVEVANGEVLIQDNTKRVINALRRAFKDNQPLANEMLRELERVGGKRVTEDLVGMYFSNWIPASLGLNSLVGGVGVGLASSVNPLAATAGLAASPMVVGQTSALTGQITQGLRNINPQLLQLLQAGGRVGTANTIKNVSR